MDMGPAVSDSECPKNLRRWSFRRSTGAPGLPLPAPFRGPTPASAPLLLTSLALPAPQSYSARVLIPPEGALVALSFLAGVPAEGCGGQARERPGQWGGEVEAG